MTDDTRGFSRLICNRIIKVDAGAINEVVLHDELGNTYYIRTETGPIGIPVITLTTEE